jgi:hypothetical protein
MNNLNLNSIEILTQTQTGSIVWNSFLDIIVRQKTCLKHGVLLQKYLTKLILLFLFG